MSAGHVRPATLADIPRMTEIRAGVRENVLSDPGKVTRADYVRFITEGEIWVWEEDRRLLGFSAGEARDGSIWAVFVEPGHEGKGIGRALLAQACATLRRAGFRQAILSTEAGTRADRFYQSAGWTAAGRNEDGENVYTRNLD